MSEQQKPKRRHHHVWQHYLKPWATGGSISCLQNGRVFATGTTRIAVEKDFYKFHRLTAADERMVKSLFATAHPAARRSFESLLNKLMSPFRLIELLPGAKKNEAITKHLDDYTSDVLEELHSQVEARFIPSLKCALEGDISFYDDERCLDFLDYITKQYMRTKGIKERFFASSEAVGDADMRRAWNMLSLMFAQNIGASLYVERKRRKLVLLRNESDAPFITGDQPVINLAAKAAMTTSLSIFYPLSPALALWLGEVDEGCPYPAGTVTDDDIRSLNHKIFEASYQQVFATSMTVLESLLRNLTGNTK